MCDKYSPPKFDTRTRGRKGWKVIMIGPSGWCGPYENVNVSFTWERARSDIYFRAGFHGFCFFFDKTDAVRYCEGELNWSGRPPEAYKVVPIRVKGLIKRAKVEQPELICYLAEYIKFDALYEVPQHS